MLDAPIWERTIFLSEAPAGRGDYRLAGAVVVVSAAAFLVLVPFAKAPLRTAPFPAAPLPKAARIATAGRLPALIASNASTGPHALTTAPSLVSPGSAR